MNRAFKASMVSGSASAKVDWIEKLVQTTIQVASPAGKVCLKYLVLPGTGRGYFDVFEAERRWLATGATSS